MKIGIAKKMLSSFLALVIGFTSVATKVGNAYEPKRSEVASAAKLGKAAEDTTKAAQIKASVIKFIAGCVTLLAGAAGAGYLYQKNKTNQSVQSLTGEGLSNLTQNLEDLTNTIKNMNPGNPADEKTISNLASSMNALAASQSDSVKSNKEMLSKLNQKISNITTTVTPVIDYTKLSRDLSEILTNATKNVNSEAEIEELKNEIKKIDGKQNEKFILTMLNFIATSIAWRKVGKLPTKIDYNLLNQDSELFNRLTLKAWEDAKDSDQRFNMAHFIAKRAADLGFTAQVKATKASRRKRLTMFAGIQAIFTLALYRDIVWPVAKLLGSKTGNFVGNYGGQALDGAKYYGGQALDGAKYYGGQGANWFKSLGNKANNSTGSIENGTNSTVLNNSQNQTSGTNSTVLNNSDVTNSSVINGTNSSFINVTDTLSSSPTPSVPPQS